MIQPYYSDATVTLYHGDMREILPALDVQADAVITDPPYGETSLAWDKWPDGWPALVAQCTRSLWCFGSMRMFLNRIDEFTGWRLAQDVVWEKHNGAGTDASRFRRVHELATFWYRGSWQDVRHEVPRVPVSFDPRRRQGAGALGRADRLAHTGAIGPHRWVDDYTRLVRSVIYAKSMHRKGIHPTQKPTAILDPLIRYSVPVGGLVLDPFAGSASTLLTARSLGRRAIGIEADEKYCQRAAERLSIPDLWTEGVS